MTSAACLLLSLLDVTIGSAFMVIAARNPVHSVLFLILAFVNAAGLFMLLGAEFLAMILVVVYVGAVAVLFLFVVMMLDVDFAELRQGFLQYLPVGGLIGVILPARAAARRRRLVVRPEPSARRSGADAAADASPTPRRSGSVLYTRYVYFFQAAGLILLVAMIGAIVLTLRHKAGVKRQAIAAADRAHAGDGRRVRKVPSSRAYGASAMTVGLCHYLDRRAPSCSRSASSASSSTARTSSSS